MNRRIRLLIFECIAFVLGVSLPCAAQIQYDTSPGAQTGVQMYGSYFSADIDTVNLYNGNVMLHLGLFSLPGRELSTGLNLEYNSQKWEQKICPDGSGGSYACGSQHTGGWRIANTFGSLTTFSEVIDYYDGWYLVQANAYYIDGVGTKHRYLYQEWFSDPYPTFNGLTVESIDGDRSKIVLDNDWASNGRAHIYLANGSNIYFDGGAPYQFTTANGNYLINSTNGSKLPLKDTLGRTYSPSGTPLSVVPYAAGTIGSTADTYTVKDSSGTDRTYSILYKTHSAHNPIINSSETRGSDRSVIDTISLPVESGQPAKTWAFEYGHDQRFLTKVTFPTGAYIRYEYYGGLTDHNAAHDYITKRIVSATGSGDEKEWIYSRSDSGGTRTVTVTSPEGEVVVHTFNAQGQETSTVWKNSSNVTLKTVTTSWTQDSVQSNGQAANARVTTVVTTLDGGLSSTAAQTYSSGLLTQATLTAYGASTVVSKKVLTYTTISGAVNRDVISTETAYGIDVSSGSLVVQGKKEYFYDGSGIAGYSLSDRGSSVPNHTHSTSTTGRGNLTTVRAYKDASNYIETKSWYDNVGNVIKSVDGLSHETTIEFDDNFTDSTNRYTFAYAKKVINPLSQYATSKYDFNTGLVKEVTNVRGQTTTTAYDLLNRVTNVTEPAITEPIVGATHKITTYVYDDSARKTKKEVTVDTANHKGRVETYFDKLYRTVKTVTNDPGGAIASKVEFDDNGRVKKTSNPHRVDSSGDPTETIYWTQTAYDGLSRPATVTAPDNSTISYAYSNNVTTTTDQAGNQRRYTYNVLGQLVQVEEPKPTLATPAITTYAYYGFGPLYQSSQSSQTRTWVYNWLGQMTSQTLPESGTTSFTYDGAGRLWTKTDARSIVTTLTYNDAGQITGRSYSDSTPSVSYTYPSSGSMAGLRTAMSDGLGSVAYTYDARERLTQEARTLTGIGGTHNDCNGSTGSTGTFYTCYAYNVKGDVTKMTYPSGRVVNFGYAMDSSCCNSRLASVVDGTTGLTLLDDITFNAAGSVTAQTLNHGSNAITETFSYDYSRLQLTGIQAVKGSTSVMNFSYDYGTSSTNTGRVLSRTDSIQPEHSANYVYDSIYRLQQAANPNANWGISWKFDTWGNRLNQYPQGLASGPVLGPGTDLSYSGNRQTGVTNMTYDNVGNLTNEGVSGSHYYAYDAENHQISMDGGAATYSYDGEGRRMKKVTSSETTYTFYGAGGIISEFIETNTSATTASSSDKTVYRTSEKTGTAVLIFNTSGTVIENNRTFPYGEAWLNDVASTNDKKFTTYDRDKESGLDYAMNRMYASTMGRMTSPDKGRIFLNAPSSLNRYAYTASDPINKNDPSGNEFTMDWRECRRNGGTITNLYLSTYTSYIYGEDGYLEEILNYYDSIVGVNCEYPEAPADGGGGGGAGHVALGQNPQQVIGRITNIQNSQTAFRDGYNAVMGRLGDLWNMLTADTDCATAMSGPNMTAREGLEYLMGHFIVADVLDTTGAAYRAGATVDAAGMTVNALFFFNNDVGIAGTAYTTGTAMGRNLMLLHELGHVTGAIPDDGPAGNNNLSPANTAFVESHCLYSIATVL